MFFGQDRDQLRQFYFDAWNKSNKGEELIPLEKIIADIIRLHPEYHAMLEKPEQAKQQDFTPEMGQSNPFLHMGMHIAIHEQLSTNRPFGIQDVYRQLLAVHQDAHKAEHMMMDCLGEAMWLAQRNGSAPDEMQYLENLKKLL